MATTHPHDHEIVEGEGDLEFAALEAEDDAEELSRKTRSRLSTARAALYEPRPLLQYVQGGMLHARAHTRHIGFDELFFDLIIVASIAASGENLRATFDGSWRSVERFILLYGTAIFVWRDATMMWNYVGTKRDLFEKTTVVSLIVCIVGIGAGAETAFRGTTKPTALAAFLANVVLAIRALLRTRGSPLAEQSEAQEDTETFGLRAPGRLSGLVDATALVLSAVPYLVAFAIGDGEGAGDQDRQDTLVVLFWVALGLGLLRTLALQQLLAVLTSNTSLVLPTANVHALAERYGLITIIVFGETFLSTLIEGAAVFSNASATRIIVGTGIAAAITYSLHSLYFDVDNRLLRSDKHALRRSRAAASLWVHLHFILHMGLILGESAAGILIEQVGEAANEEAAEEEGAEPLAPELLTSGVRRNNAFSLPSTRLTARVESNIEGEEATVSRGVHPSSEITWLLCASYAVALATMAAIAILHKRDLRFHKTRYVRLSLRILTWILLITAVGIPYSTAEDAGALGLLGSVGAVIILCALIETLFAASDELHGRANSAPARDETDESTVVADHGDAVSAHPSHGPSWHGIRGLGHHAVFPVRTPDIIREQPFRGYGHH